jgi:hypothetical protein
MANAHTSTSRVNGSPLRRSGDIHWGVPRAPTCRVTICEELSVLTCVVRVVQLINREIPKSDEGITIQSKWVDKIRPVICAQWSLSIRTFSPLRECQYSRLGLKRWADLEVPMEYVSSMKIFHTLCYFVQLRQWNWVLHFVSVGR